MAKKKKNKNESLLYLTFLFIIILLAFKYIQFVIIIIIILCTFILIRKYLKWRKLHSYKISDIDNMDGLEFEYYIAKLLENQDFKNVEVTQGSGDFGIDILGFLDNESYAIQVKRYEKNVSRTAVSDAISGKDFYKCDKSMVITNSYFTKGAIEMAETLNCQLIDKDILINWIYDFNKKK